LEIPIELDHGTGQATGISTGRLDDELSPSGTAYRQVPGPASTPAGCSAP